MSDYSDLRTLLLGREIDAIASLQADLQRLSKELHDPEEIVARLAPHIDAIIERNIGLGRETLVGVLSPIIADVLSKQIEQSQDAIAKTLAPVIGKAISVQIKTQRDEVVDALYPVIGTTVARYVSQAFKDLLQNINHQLNNAFSIRNLRRKLLAKIKGIPESELLLAESASWKVESIFLIHKQSGLLIAQKERPDSALSEPEMVASMLTAIRSFVNEWISNNGSDSEVEQIEYGNSTIYLEVAGSCYLAAVVSGTVSSRLTQAISAALSHILEAQEEKIRQFNGDRSLIDSGQIDLELESVMSLEPTTEEEDKNRIPLMVLAGVLFVGVIYAGYIGVTHYRYEQEAEALNAAFKQDPELALYPVSVSVDDKKIVLSGAVETPEQSEWAESKVRPLLHGKTIENRLLIARRPEKGVDSETVQRLTEALASLHRAEPFKMRFYFDVGSAQIKAQQRYKAEMIRLARALHPEYRIKIEGYSDRSGTEAARLMTAAKRAKAVKALLQREDVNVTRYDISYFSSLPSDVNGSNFSPEQARVVIVELIPENEENSL